VDEFARLQPRHLRHHLREERVGGDVERHAEEHVGTALVELAGEPAFRDVELEQAVAGRQRHAVHLRDVPCRHDQAARFGIATDHLDEVRDLIDDAPVRRFPAAPLLAVNGAELAFAVRPLIPDRDAVFLQVADVGVAREEPEQLVRDRFQVQLLRRQHREAIGEIEAHLVPENAERSRAGAVAALGAVTADAGEKVEILLHGERYTTPRAAWREKTQIIQK